MKYKIKIIIKNLLGHSLKIMLYFFVQWIYGQMCQSAKAQNYGQYGQMPKCQTVANVPHHKIYLHLPIDFFINTV
jgi:hypothetical protein